MRKMLSVLMLWGWFFAVESPYKPGIRIVQVIGLFKTEAECKVERANIEDRIKDFGVPYKISPCIREQEA
jgi:hypothetical protein